MTMNKQIEEMARAIGNSRNACLFDDCLKCWIYGACMYQEIAQDLYDNGYRKQSEGEWISVEDRLPDRPGQYLVYTWNGYILICNCCDYLLDGDLQFDNVNVTHWMPLPNPPKMKGGAKE